MSTPRNHRTINAEMFVKHAADELDYGSDDPVVAIAIDDYTNNNYDRSILADKETRARYIALCHHAQRLSAAASFYSRRVEQLPVLVDMDNVLVDYEKETKRQLLELYPDICLRPDDEAPYIEDLTLNERDRQLVLDLQYTRGHFLNMPPVEGAVEGWQALIELGYHPQIASAPLSKNYWCIQEKLGWIDQYLGPQAVDEALIAPDKSAYKGFALIDDMPKVRNAEKAMWQHIVFDQPYNQQSASEYRLYGWKDPRLSTVLAQCALRAGAF